MKRSALIMVTLLAGAALMFAGCNNGTTDTTDTTKTTTVEYATGVTSATLAANSTYNYQAVIAWLDTAKSYTPTTGDTLIFHMVGTSDAAVDEFKGFLVDNAAPSYGWSLISSYVNAGSGTSGTTNAFDVTMEFALTGTASACDAGACKLGLYMDISNGHEANLTFTTF